MIFQNDVKSNLESFTSNYYPGRGIIIGMSPNSKFMVQIYWTAGRTENSQNRVIIKEDTFIRTKVYTSKEIINPSLIIYYAAKDLGPYHIVSNGEQTDTIYDCLVANDSFESAINLWEFEHDPPIYTPRISALVDVNSHMHSYKLAINKSINKDPRYCVRNFYNYETAIPGIGHCIHTYDSICNTITTFNREPFMLEVFDDIDKTISYYWTILNSDTKVAMFVKYIEIATNRCEFRLENRHTAHS